MNCCDNPITPPAQCTRRCPKLVDACCVANADNLPCLYPPIVIGGTGAINQFTITVDDSTGIVLPEYGSLLVAGTGVGVGALVTKIAGNLITVDLANTAAVTGDITFSLVEQRQCDINTEVDERICEIFTGAVPCHTYTDVVFTVGPGLEWTSLSPVQYSDPLFCQARLRGVASATIPGTQTFQIESPMFTIPAGPSRPLRDLVFSVVANIQDPLAVDNTAIHLPAILTLTTLGVVTLTVIHPNPCDPCNEGDPYFDVSHELTLIVSFDSITYEIQA